MFSVLKIQNYTLQPYSDLLILSEKLEICRSNKTISGSFSVQFTTLSPFQSDYTHAKWQKGSGINTLKKRKGCETKWPAVGP